MAEITIQDAWRLGVRAQQARNFEEAERYYLAILAASPNHADANHNLGVLRVELGRWNEALPLFQKAIDANPNKEQYWINYVGVSSVNNKLKDAQNIIRSAKKRGLPQDFINKLQTILRSNQPKGNAKDPERAVKELIELYNKENLEEVVERAQALTKQYPRVFVIWNILGAAAAQIGNSDQAAFAFKKAISLNPKDSEVVNNMGNVLSLQGNLDEAIEAYKKAIALRPKYPIAYYNLGNALKKQDKINEAIEAYKNAIALKPDYVDAYNNLGVALKTGGRLDEAISTYKKLILLKPYDAYSLNNLGNAFNDQGNLDEAIEAYKKAIALEPEYAEAFTNLGCAFEKKEKRFEAIEAYKKAIALKPDYANAHYNLGIALSGEDRQKEAITAWQTAISLNPGDALVNAVLLFEQAKICDWNGLKQSSELLQKLGVIGDAITPFSVLALEDEPQRHQQRAINYAQKIFPKKDMKQVTPPTEKPERLRIGYFSADFHNHPVMYQLAQVFAAHDKSQFTIIAFSYGPSVQDEMRQYLISNADVFHDVRAMTDIQVVELARSERLDIAVDLTGYTSNQRLSLFSYHLAPIQISYLGYPGTLGADFIDYIIADPVVIPEENRRFYFENIIYLPNTFLPTDNKRVIADKKFTREEMGLPKNGFVFCCFNDNYKLSPKEFDIWMRLLRKVEGSVLWLRKTNEWSISNLRMEAEARGISGDRLIFAERLSLPEEHLARHHLADLFLDTFNYNAHATTSDALWTGLPVITKLGRGFPARVAGSLLSAVGLQDLITDSEAQYEALALRLATTPTDLAQIKSKLAANRLTQPLFDSEMYTKHLERAYQIAYDRYFNGHQPDTILI